MGAAAIPLIGGGLSAVGGMNEDQERQWQLEDEAIIAQKNAKVARETGAYNARRQELEANQRIGSIEADASASGLAADSGNVLDILRQSAVNAELDRQNILRGAELNARNYDLRAAQAKYGIGEIKRAGPLKVFSTLFGAGARAAQYGGGGNGKISDFSQQDSGPSKNGFGSAGGGSDLSGEFRRGNLAADSRRYNA